jgi:hypothetical protein
MEIEKDVQLQRDYYTKTAQEYNKMHVSGVGEHDLACALIVIRKYFPWMINKRK